MSSIPAELKYAATHEWVEIDEQGIVTIGISDHAQELLGDVVFIELPEPGATLTAGEEAGVVESVKAASDMYAPVSGEVVAVNEALEECPELVNSDPYGDGWLFRVKASDVSDLDSLLDPEAYKAKVAEE